MEQKELEYLRQVEDHASRTGWVSPLTREDKEYFAYLRQVSKRYNIDMSKANRLEYNFVIRVAGASFTHITHPEKCRDASIFACAFH